jgi:DHA2 family multidrug resistance protein
VVREAVAEHPWISLRFVVSGNIPLLVAYITFFRFVILSTSYLIPQFLTIVQGYRALEIGGVLVWIAMPQFLVAPIVATFLRFVEPRIMLALGFTLIGIACFMDGQLTGDWASGDFLPSQVLQAVGQSIALTSVVWFFLQHLDPAHVLTFGAVLQTGRLFGAELGTAFVQTFVRVREQLDSNLIGLHVVTGSPETVGRLQDYANAVMARSIGGPSAGARATALLAAAVRKQAYVLAFVDGFMFLGFATISALLLMLLLRKPPGLGKTQSP